MVKKYLTISLQGLCDLGKDRVIILKCYISSHFSEKKNETQPYGLTKIAELSTFLFKVDDDLGSGAVPGMSTVGR